MSSGIHEELVERFRYFDGHSDTIGLFADAGGSGAAGLARARDRYLGLSHFVDQLRPEVRDRLEPVAAVALASELHG
jgi:hypothetical protein